ncbi:CHAD domain-containing protein [Salana multivorans]|uniref:CHAD domain-containing protein n=1 Tax=Salana multivorans TaxID=120377 RepID=A0A3N2DBN7_9MICO|nr:CYTH and CHAD domain-containing protein [Salana multivorans]ROR97068.1 CHAD domain-containing protein [Salana multivorans]
MPRAEAEQTRRERSGRRPAESVERELKLRLAPGTPLPPLDLPGIEVRRRGVVALHAIYHDTPDARLARWGITLRRRTGGEDEGWHLKLGSRSARSGLDRRVELHVPLAAGEVGQPPAELLDVVAALTRGVPVVPLAGVQTRRRLWELVAPGLGAGDAAGDGAAEAVAVALVSDDGVVTTRIGPDGELHQGEVFREIEVELVLDADGRPHPRAKEVVRALRRLLRDVGATPSPRSKGAQALGGLARGSADVTVPEVPRKPTVAELLRVVVARQVTELLDADVRVRRGEETGVHDLRVAARTLRSVLRTFAPVLDEEWARDLRRELAWIAGAFGEVRDIEVQVELLHADAARLADDPVAGAPGDAGVAEPDGEAGVESVSDTELARAAVVAALEPRFVAAHRRAVEDLRSERYLALVDALVAAAGEPGVRADRSEERARRALAPLVAAAARRARRRVKLLRAGRDPHAWHRARIGAKRARYAADALALVGWRPAERAAARLKKATAVLGDVHDAHVARGMLREIALSGDGLDRLTPYLLGRLDGVEAARELELQEAFLDSRPRLRRVLEEL